ncbi:hypothetical protein ACXZ9C_11085 [Streptococcus agalactiae]
MSHSSSSFVVSLVTRRWSLVVSGGSCGRRWLVTGERGSRRAWRGWSGWRRVSAGVATSAWRSERRVCVASRVGVARVASRRGAWRGWSRRALSRRVARGVAVGNFGSCSGIVVVVGRGRSS